MRSRLVVVVALVAVLVVAVSAQSDIPGFEYVQPFIPTSFPWPQFARIGSVTMPASFRQVGSLDVNIEDGIVYAASSRGVVTVAVDIETEKIIGPAEGHTPLALSADTAIGATAVQYDSTSKELYVAVHGENALPTIGSGARAHLFKYDLSEDSSALEDPTEFSGFAYDENAWLTDMRLDPENDRALLGFKTVSGASLAVPRVAEMTLSTFSLNTSYAYTDLINGADPTIALGREHVFTSSQLVVNGTYDSDIRSSNLVARSLDMTVYNATWGTAGYGHVVKVLATNEVASTGNIQERVWYLYADPPVLCYAAWPTATTAGECLEFDDGDIPTDMVVDRRSNTGYVITGGVPGKIFRVPMDSSSVTISSDDNIVLDDGEADEIRLRAAVIDYERGRLIVGTSGDSSTKLVFIEIGGPLNLPFLISLAVALGLLLPCIGFTALWFIRWRMQSGIRRANFKALDKGEQTSRLRGRRSQDTAGRGRRRKSTTSTKSSKGTTGAAKAAERRNRAMEIAAQSANDAGMDVKRVTMAGLTGADTSALQTQLAALDSSGAVVAKNGIAKRKSGVPSAAQTLGGQYATGGSVAMAFAAAGATPGKGKGWDKKRTKEEKKKQKEMEKLQRKAQKKADKKADRKAAKAGGATTASKANARKSFILPSQNDNRTEEEKLADRLARQKAIEERLARKEQENREREAREKEEKMKRVSMIMGAKGLDNSAAREESDRRYTLSTTIPTTHTKKADPRPRSASAGGAVPPPPGEQPPPPADDPMAVPPVPEPEDASELSSSSVSSVSSSSESESSSDSDDGPED